MLSRRFFVSFVVLLAVAVLLSAAPVAQAQEREDGSVYLPLVSSSGVGPSEISVDFRSHVDDTELKKEILNVLMNRPEELLPGSAFVVTSRRDENTWQFLSIASVSKPECSPNLIGSGNCGSLVLAERKDDKWRAALRGTESFSSLLDDVPESVLSEESRAVLDPLTILPAALQMQELLFPWRAGNEWEYWNGWEHSQAGQPRALDIGTRESDKTLLSSGSGTITYICRGTLTANIHIEHGNMLFKYFHVDIRTIDPQYISETRNVARGQVIGELREGTWESDGCGYANQNPGSAHLHWEIPTNTTITADGWSIRYPDNAWRKGGQTRNPNQSPYDRLPSTNAPVIYGENGAVGGRVRNTDNSTVSSAEITLTRGDFSQSTTTNLDGIYRFSNVPVGSAYLLAQKGNLVGSVGTTVRADTTTNVDIVLGTCRESVFASDALNDDCNPPPPSDQCDDPNPDKDEVVLFENPDYEGQCKKLGHTNDINDPGDVDGINLKKVSSIRIGVDTEAKLCKNEDEDGPCRTFRDSQRRLEDNGYGDEIESMRIRDKSCQSDEFEPDRVALYGDTDQNNPCELKDIGVYAYPEQLDLSNDSISSLWVGDEVEVVLCRRSELRDCKVFRSSTNRLPSNMEDDVSSAEVRPRRYAPDAPALTEPANDARFVEGEPVILRWSDEGDEYEVELNGTRLGWQLEEYLVVTNYVTGSNSWRVRARNEVGTGNWSDPRDFIIEPAGLENDQKVNATEIGLDHLFFTFDLTDATVDEDDNHGCGSPTRSIWYELRPDEDFDGRFTTVGTDVIDLEGVRIAVLHGSELIGCSHTSDTADSDIGMEPVPFSSGETYHISVFAESNATSLSGLWDLRRHSEACQTVEFETTIDGQLPEGESVNSHDYCLDATAGEWASIRMFAQNDTTLDTYLNLYDPEGNLVASNDDGMHIGLNSYLNFQFPNNGTYRLEATRYGTTSGDFRLRIESGRQAAIGDVNRDCVVNLDDSTTVLNAYGNYNVSADINLDGVVDDFDTQIVTQQIFDDMTSCVERLGEPTQKEMNVWRVLHLVYHNIDVDYIASDGSSSHLATSMTGVEVENSLQSFRQYASIAHDFSEEEALVDYDIVHVQRPIDSLTSVGDWYWVSPEDTQQELNELAPVGKYDSVLVSWPQTDFTTGQQIPSGGWGLAIGASGWSNGATYATVANARARHWQQPTVGEPWLHEWLHGVAYHYQNQGYTMPERDADGGELHGYTHSPTLGWSAYYRDLMTGQVVEDGVPTGITADVWRSGTILDQRAHALADYFYSNTLSSYEVIGSAQWDSNHQNVSLGTGSTADNKLYTSIEFEQSFSLEARVYVPDSNVGWHDSIALALSNQDTEYWAMLFYGTELVEKDSIALSRNDVGGELYPLVLNPGWYTVKVLVDYEDETVQMKAWSDTANEPSWQTSMALDNGWRATKVGFRHYGQGTQVDDLMALSYISTPSTSPAGTPAPGTPIPETPTPQAPATSTPTSIPPTPKPPVTETPNPPVTPTKTPIGTPSPVTATPTGTITVTATATALPADPSGTPQPSVTATPKPGATPISTPPAVQTPVAGAILPETGGTISGTMGIAVEIDFPPGAHGEPFTVSMGPVAEPPSTGVMKLLGRIFSIVARDGADQPVTQFDQPYTLTVRYQDADVAGMNEADLVLHYWDVEGERWVEVGTAVDAEANTLTASLDHLTDFAVLEVVRMRVYLPTVQR